LGGFGSGRGRKRLDVVSVNHLLYSCYQLTLQLLRSPDVSKEKKLEVASRLVQRIIPERIQIDAQVELSEDERAHQLEVLSRMMEKYRPTLTIAPEPAAAPGAMPGGFIARETEAAEREARRMLEPAPRKARKPEPEPAHQAGPGPDADAPSAAPV